MKKFKFVEIDLKGNKNIFILIDNDNDIYIPFFYFVKIFLLYITKFKLDIDNKTLNTKYKNKFTIIKSISEIKIDKLFVKENLNISKQNFINIHFILQNKQYFIYNILNILNDLNIEKNIFEINIIFDNLTKYILTETFLHNTKNNIEINKKFLNYGFGKLFIPYIFKSNQKTNLYTLKSFSNKNIMIKNFYLNDIEYYKFLNLDYNKFFTIPKDLFYFMINFCILIFHNVCIFNNNIKSKNIFIGLDSHKSYLYYNVYNKNIQCLNINNKINNKFLHAITICSDKFIL